MSSASLKTTNGSGGLPKHLYGDWTRELSSDTSLFCVTVPEGAEKDSVAADSSTRMEACALVCRTLPTETLLYKGVTLRRGEAADILRTELEFTFAACLGTACNYGFHNSGPGVQGQVVTFQSTQPLLLVDMVDPHNHRTLLEVFGADHAVPWPGLTDVVGSISLVKLLHDAFGIDSSANKDADADATWKRTNHSYTDTIFSRWFNKVVTTRFPEVHGWFVLPVLGDTKWHDELCVTTPARVLCATNITIRFRHGVASDVDVCVDGLAVARLPFSHWGVAKTHPALLSQGRYLFGVCRGHREDRYTPNVFKQADAFMWTDDRSRLLQGPQHISNFQNYTIEPHLCELDQYRAHALLLWV